MAIVAFDNFQTTLAAALADTDTEMTIPDAAAAALFTAARLSFDSQVWGDATQRLIRVPLFLDDGTHQERILLPLPAVEGGPTPIERGGVKYSFASGATVRCAPSAEHVAQGHAGLQELHGVTQALVVPGELVAIGGVGAAAFTLQFPEESGGVAHLGECWPARVLLAITTTDAVTVSFKKYNMTSDAPVLLKGVAGLSASVELPAGAVFAMFTIQRLPVGLPPYGIRGYYGWLVSVETWS